MVLDATTGQNGLIQARQFGDTAGLTGIVLTKLDGTAKGGIVFAIAQQTGLPGEIYRRGRGCGGSDALRCPILRGGAAIMKIVLASDNGNKLREFRELLAGSGVEILSKTEAGCRLEVEETGDSFAENARQKAVAVMRAAAMPALADDSGLCVDALGGARACIRPGTQAGTGTAIRTGTACF